MARTEEYVSLTRVFSSTSLESKESAATSLNSNRISLEATKKKLQVSDKTQVDSHRSEKRKRHHNRLRSGTDMLTPIKGKETLRRRLCRKVDVRYAKEISRFINKYSILNCNQNKCSMLEERLAHHKAVCRGRHSSVVVSKNLREQGVSAFQSVSQCKLYASDNAAQTDITVAESIDVPLKKCATEVIKPNRNIYREHLQNEIINWFHNIPIFYSLDFTATYFKDNIAVMLVDNIYKFATQKCRESYEGVVKKQIDDCLNILPMWLPNCKQDQILFKNNLRDRLYQRINELNTIYLDRQLVKNNVMENEDLNMGNSLRDECNLYYDDNAYAQEVADWLEKIKFSQAIISKVVTENIMKALSSVLNEPVRTTNYKLLLQGKVIEELDKLPLHSDYTQNKAIHLIRFAEDLTNRLLNIKLHIHSPADQVVENHKKETIYSDYSKQTVIERIDKVLKNAKLNNRQDAKEDICDFILNSLETLRSGIEKNINNEIYDILRKKYVVKQERAMSIANKIKFFVKIGLEQNDSDKIDDRLQLSQSLAILSAHITNKGFAATTSHQSKRAPSLNPEELSYSKKVAALIRVWVETLPLTYKSDKNFDEAVIMDLVLDIMGETKQQNQSNQTKTEKDKCFNCLVNRWLLKLNVFDDFNDAEPFVISLLENLKHIPIPILTTAHNARCQVMENEKYLQGILGRNIHFTAKPKGVLEEQISIWIKEQPSDIYINKDVNIRTELVTKLANTLQHLNTKYSKETMDNIIKQWLREIVKPELKDSDIELLTHNLKAKLENIFSKEIAAPITSYSVSNDFEIKLDTSDKHIKEFIQRHLKHNYRSEDSLTKEIIGQLLLIELQKLRATTCNEIYHNFENDTSLEPFWATFTCLLEYVTIISHWLRTLPVNPLYNSTNNRQRVDFISKLAKNIHDTDNQRKNNPKGLDCDRLIHSIITQHIYSYNIPILPEHVYELPSMIEQLVIKINTIRCQKKQNSPTTSSTNPRNSKKNIEAFRSVNDGELAPNKLKVEIYSAFQIKTKRNISQYLRGMNLQHVDLQKLYIKEISEWLESIPILPVVKTSETRDKAKMITELAEKLMEREETKCSDPDNNAAEKMLVGYLKDWISNLPLDPHKKVVIPVLIQQLMNSIEKVNRSTKKLEESTLKNVKTVRSSHKDPGLEMVTFIENWCHQLPIEADDETKLDIMADIARKVYQKMGELNIDPGVVRDENLYKDLLEDEVDAIFENVPLKLELKNDYNNLKSELISTILDINKKMKQKFAGTNYKYKLQTTLNASIPNPIHSTEIFDPGFEIYKNYLANMFILDNFDHSNVDVKSKYERRIRLEIDKYFQSAQNKNALPITKGQMYDELYSVLFKVPMPNEKSIIDEVEEVKTRCEIDAWFEELPIMITDDVAEMLEWDQMLSTLTKKIHDVEKNDSEPNEKIRKEVTKVLKKLPLISEQKDNIDQFIDKLITTLKSSAEARKYVAIEHKLQKGKSPLKHENSVNENVSQIAGPSSNGVKRDKLYEHGVIPNDSTPKFYKCPEEQMEDIVEKWCNELPWIGDQLANKIIKNDISTKILIKIFELNMDPDAFNDDIVYDQLLDEELNKIISELHDCCNFGENKPTRIYQLKEMIKSIKPLIKDVKEMHEYKIQLKKIVESVLKDHKETKANIAQFNKLKKEIVDNFIQHNYYRNDDVAKQTYKTNIYDAILKYDSGVKDIDEHADPLIRRNQLLCELSKIPTPSERALKEEVEQIKMQYEVELLFKENNLDDQEEKTSQIKKVLTKRLNDIEKSGHTEFNETKMNVEVTKCLQKLGKDVNPQVVDTFVTNLKNNEDKRKYQPCHSDGEHNDVNPLRPQSATIISSRRKFSQQFSPPASLPYSFRESNHNVKRYALPLPAENMSNQSFDINFKLRSNEPWNIYRPEVNNHARDSLSFEDFEERDIIQSPMVFRELQNEAHPFHPIGTQVIRTDSVFQGPSFVPQRLYSPLRLQHTDHPIYPSVRNLSRQSIPITSKRGTKPSRHSELCDGERYRCICGKRSRCKVGRYCMMPVDDYCDECGGFKPTWCRVFMPGCFYFNF